MNLARVTQIMVDDAAAIVIMLGPEPKQAAQKLTAPPAAGVASVSNTVANSPEAKAARDKLAAIPYQNFFKHLQLVRTQSIHPPPTHPCIVPCVLFIDCSRMVCSRLCVILLRGEPYAHTAVCVLCHSAELRWGSRPV